MGKSYEYYATPWLQSAWNMANKRSCSQASINHKQRNQMSEMNGMAALFTAVRNVSFSVLPSQLNRIIQRIPLYNVNRSLQRRAAISTSSEGPSAEQFARVRCIFLTAMEFDSRVIATVTLFVAVTIGAIGMSVYGMRGASGTAHKKKSHSKQKVDKYKRPRSRSNSRTKHSVSDDSDADESMRGYKKTSTGKTTTYFNRELSEHESIILGDMTPRRIDASEVQSSSVSPAPTGGSVWNSAGTYEEKNITSWAQKRLNETVLNTVYCLPTDGMAMVMSVKSVEGDAAVSMIRGKKRYLYDMSVNLTWKLDSNNATATGKMSITDISAECCHEVVVSDIQSSNPAGLTASVINKHIKSETNSLTQALSDSLQRFYQEMKSTF